MTAAMSDLRERVARAIWVALTDVNPEMRDGIWNKTDPAWKAVLGEDSLDGVYSCSASSPLTRQELLQCASAVLNIAMEEAIRAAEAFPVRDHGALGIDPHAAAEQASREIAAAIRALANGPGGTALEEKS